MRRIFAALVVIGISLGITRPARGQSDVQVGEPLVSYRYGAALTIEAEINTGVPIQMVEILWQPEGEPQQTSWEATLTPPNQVLFTLNLGDNPITIFSQVSYWFQVTLETGEIVTSNEYTFNYLDNRWNWHTLETEEFVVYWYAGNPEFGQAIMEAAYEGLARIRLHMNVPEPNKVRYYVYANSQELQATLQLSGNSASLIAGHANPVAGTIMVSLPPGPAASLEIKRQVPHELAHILLYEKLGAEQYFKQPRWLVEGLASAAELFPNPDYPILLEKAYGRQVLLSMENLCQSFPTDATNFQLAYAQASSFTWYLQAQYGDTGIEDLLMAYASGLGCERGPEVALGNNLTMLEQDWRRITFNENLLLTALSGILPWVVIFAVVLLPSSVIIVGDSLKRRNNK